MHLIPPPTHTHRLADRQYQLTVVQLFNGHKDGRKIATRFLQLLAEHLHINDRNTSAETDEV